MESIKKPKVKKLNFQKSSTATKIWQGLQSEIRKVDKEFYF